MPETTPRLRHVRTLLVLAVPVAAAFCLWLAGRTYLDHLSVKYLAFDRARDRAFRSVRAGMSRAEVVARMGRPARESPEFQLGQRHGYEEQYERAAASGARAHLVWHNGIDYTYCVGLDEAGKVVVKGAGGT